MLIIPAIDLRNGKVVRLSQGDAAKEKVYSEDPLEVAKLWEAQGAELIHVVDLDGALTGECKNLDAVSSIVRNIKARVQFGGGLRSTEAVDAVFAIGVEKAVLGTVAVLDKKLMQTIRLKYRDKIIISADIKNQGRLAVNGWVNTAGEESGLADFAKDLQSLGVNEIIYTDIERDGTLAGPRIEVIRTDLQILSKFGIFVIIAGGIASLLDIKLLSELEGLGLKGLILGKALYEGRFTLSEAKKICSPKE